MGWDDIVVAGRWRVTKNLQVETQRPYVRQDRLYIRHAPNDSTVCLLLIVKITKPAVVRHPEANDVAFSVLANLVWNPFIYHSNAVGNSSANEYVRDRPDYYCWFRLLCVWLFVWRNTWCDAMCIVVCHYIWRFLLLIIRLAVFSCLLRHNCWAVWWMSSPFVPFTMLRCT